MDAGVAPVAAAVDFFQKTQDFGLHQIKAVCGAREQIPVLRRGLLKQIHIIRRLTQQFITVFLTDPEDKAPVRRTRIR